MNSNPSNRATAELRRHTISKTGESMDHLLFDSTMETFLLPLPSVPGHQLSNEGCKVSNKSRHVSCEKCTKAYMNRTIRQI